MDPIGATEKDKWDINFLSRLVMDPIGATEQDKWEINFLVSVGNNQPPR